MGQSLSTVYFDKETARPHLRVITLVTALFLGTYLKAFSFGVATIRDDLMQPFLNPGKPFSDIVIYQKFTLPKEKLANKIVAVRDPASIDKIALRRVIAEENQWVQRIDDGGLIKVPMGHVWIEQENENVPRFIDSLADEIGGPISKKFVLGPALRIVWPVWRWGSFSDMERFRRLMPQSKLQPHSRVYSNEEIYRRYGIR